MEILGKLRKFLDENWIVNLILLIFLGNLVGGLYRIAGKTQTAKIVGIVQLVLFVLGAALSGVLGLVAFLFWILEIVDIVTVIIKKKIVYFAD